MDDKAALAQSLARRGEVIGGNYVLDGVLGIGGMGVVHVAVQRSLERTVAVKMPRPELAADPNVRAMFRNEALAGSRLSHRNIVGVLDFGEYAGAPFLVMEHVVGPRLGQVLAEVGPLALPVAVELIRQIAAGLADAHSAGVVHADAKCDNVMLQYLRDGSAVPRVIDFGVAHFLDEHGVPQPAPVVTGTPEYVAPEVARGHRPTPAADVYALGVMLYELITGVTPFAGQTAGAILIQKLETDAVSLAVAHPELELPASLDALVARVLARDPAARPADAAELGRALDEACRDTVIGRATTLPALPSFAAFAAPADTVREPAYCHA